MSLKSLSSHGLIEKVSVSTKQVTSNVLRARKDLGTAKATVTIDEEWAYSPDGSREVPGQRREICRRDHAAH